MSDLTDIRMRIRHIFESGAIGDLMGEGFEEIHDRLLALEKVSHPPALENLTPRVARLERLIENPQRQKAWDEMKSLLATLNDPEHPFAPGGREDLLARVRDLAGELHRQEAL